MTYAYIRVSSLTQNIDRQLEEILKLDIERKNIFIDKQSGKDFNRDKYTKLKKKLKTEDLIIIKSIDRLGRNYEMIIEEWSDITKRIGADIKVLDMPLLDTRVHPENLVGKFIGDIVLQVLSFVAENERENIRTRQAEGIKIAMAKGVRFGRPKVVLPKDFKKIATQYKKKIITLKVAYTTLNIPKSTFYKQYKLIESSL